MDYFKILNLKQEPFSNSPEPEFFYHGNQYQTCLQKLELGVRLCRGLNVVMGDVGTGKTTLCRQLILKLAEPEEDKKQIETHLILDPSFGNPLEFLSTVAAMFGIPSSSGAISEWQIKENIKHYLFRKGVDEGATVVLIVDEGQKLPEFCVEILREFLNYETNEHKLLQIVIFAQREFEGFLRDHANFADRINQYYILKPLGFFDTMRMIRFRLAKASQSFNGPALFTLPGFWAVYRATGGYPRRINTLCHQIMLSLIIQNRTRAGWYLVRASAQRVLLSRVSKIRWAAGTAFAGLCLVLIVSYFLFPLRTGGVSRTGSLQGTGQPYLAPAPVPDVKPQAVARPALEASQREGTESSVQEKAGSEKKMPEMLGTLSVRRGASLWSIYNDIYGVFDQRRFGLLIKANPHLRSINLVKVGEVINLPALPVAGNPLSDKPYRIEIGRRHKLAEAHQLLKEYPEDLPRASLVPYWSSRAGMVYTLLLKEGFGDEGSALHALRELPPSFSKQAKVVGRWDSDTIFFSRQ